MKKIEDIILEIKNSDMTEKDLEYYTEKIRGLTFTDMGFAKVDHHRKLRNGAGEVIYAESKTPEQIIGIVSSMKEQGEENILITRLKQKHFEQIKNSFDISYDPMSKIAVVGNNNPAGGHGYILVVTAGTSDIPVAEEAAKTAEFLGNEVFRAYDCGVAGIHRLFSIEKKISDASVIIAIAGMEGALASVIGGLADCPVIAVPTGVGYGASFGGVTALLSMLSSCASGVSVVNIDNGYGAACMAHKINSLAGKRD